MTSFDAHTGLGAETDLAIQRALEAANLRAGGGASGAAVYVVDDREPSAAEAGDVASGLDAD